MWVCAVLFPLNNLELNNLMGTAVQYYATVAYCALALLRTSLTGGMEQMHRIEQYLQVSVPPCAVSPQTLISHYLQRKKNQEEEKRANVVSAGVACCRRCRSGARWGSGRDGK
jgi:hypothetical protein